MPFIFQNVSKKLVNGSVGIVQGFMTALNAQGEGIKVSITENHRPDRWIEKEEEGEVILVRSSTSDPDVGVPPSVLHSARVWPLVEFQNGVKMLCIPDTFEVYNADGRVEAQRTQVYYPPQLLPLF